MKSLSKMFVLAAVAAICMSGRAYAGSKAVVGSDLGVPMLDAKTAVGQDGNLRVIFDYNPSDGGFTYAGSALWIINPNGSVVGASNPTIPASVGSFYFTTPFGKPAYDFERSNTALFPQADGNTTVLFYYGYSGKSSANLTSFGVWTYNSSGTLIAAANYGPYTNTVIENLYFDPWGKIVVKWASPAFSQSTFFAGWVLDEYGTAVSATSYYGPYSGNALGRLRTNSSGQQIWPFCYAATGGYVTTIWTFNASGSALVNAQSFGPF
jgi:hypothetical protein